MGSEMCIRDRSLFDQKPSFAHVAMIALNSYVGILWDVANRACVCTNVMCYSYSRVPIGVIDGDIRL